MADTNPGDRPLSPHLQVYRMPLNAVISILHRATGVAMAASGLLIVWWFLAAATSEAYFDFVNGLMTSWLGDMVMTLSLIAIWFHFSNGIRHLIWDTGSYFGQKRVRRTAMVGLVFTAIMVIITIWVG
ncbi:MAG TPA: succinate dehydrogenase, cytochrome b556 subunit [Aliiroseovarius sp.]|nr:succinate dehydrogenase, cytochrome b556 subunit [Aliiroseovarius sp.]